LPGAGRFLRQPIRLLPALVKEFAMPPGVESIDVVHSFCMRVVAIGGGVVPADDRRRLIHLAK